MNTPLPEGFVRRIRKYPEHVRNQLSQTVGDAAFRDALLVLHGDVVDSTRKPGEQGSVLVDTFLSRLVISNKFQMRVESLIAFLADDKAANKAKFDLERAHDFLKALSDPQSPYLHKISEVVQVKKRELPFHASFATLLRLTRIWRVFGDRSETIEDALVGMIRNAADEGSTDVLNAVMDTLGLDIRFGLRDLPEASAAGETINEQAVCTALIRGLLAQSAEASGLGLAGSHALQELQHMMPPDEATLTLVAPRRLQVMLNSPATQADETRWQGFKEQGLIADWQVVPEAGAGQKKQADDAMTLLVPAGAALSPVLLAGLPCLEQARVAARAVIETPGNPGGWAERIIGLEDTQSQLEDVGFFWQGVQDPGKIAASDAVVAGRPLSIALAALIDTRVPLAATPENIESCYALVLQLGDDTDVAGYLNVDSCVVFEDFAALQGALKDEAVAGLTKPVVLIGPQTPRHENYIVTSVQAFWAYAGRYITGFADPGYDGAEGSFMPRQDAKTDRLCRVLITQLATMPLPLLLSHAGALAQQLTGPDAYGFLISPETLSVQVAHRGMPELADFQYLQRMIGSRSLTPAAREALFLAGQVSTHYIMGLEPTTHWPVEPLMSVQLQGYHRVRSCAAHFHTRPTADLATSILEDLRDAPDLVMDLHHELSDFVVELASNRSVFLELEETISHQFLGLVRRLGRVDEVALALAFYASDICRSAARNTIALFEVLANCLTPERLTVTLASTAMSNIGGSRRFVYRMAECLRRYGDNLTCASFLSALMRQSSPALNDPSFLHNFQGLLTASDLGTFQTMLGPEILDHIRASVKYTEAFEEAIVRRDRTALLSLAEDAAAAAGIDVLKWLDTLRGYSNELHEMEVPVSALAMPEMTRLHQRKLAAVVFSDHDALRTFEAEGYTQGDVDVDVIAQNILGHNEALNAAIVRRFENSGVTPYQIRGQTAEEVFAHAAKTTGRSGQTGSGAKKGPLVSVVMSAFNPDLGLMRQSLESIMAQTHGNIELFVVDDASTPDVGDGIRALCDTCDFAHYHRMADNSGPYVGRNYALSQAKGEYFAIHDADDWAHPERFAKQIEAFGENAFVRVVTTPHIRIDRYGRVQMEAGFTLFGDGPMTSMFRREIFDEIGGFVRTRSRGDIEMRERIRAYYGAHGLSELTAPAALCYGDSATLSQLVKAQKSHHLRAFRRHIEQQTALRHARRDYGALSDVHHPLVPLALRAPRQEDIL